MEPGTVLRIATKRRGDADPAPDRLTLWRTLWLDFDGRGYTVTDRVTGAVVRGDRLAMAPGIELGRVAVNGVDQVITRIPGEESPGIEVPRGAIELTADSRLPDARTRVPALGWDQDFSEVAAELQLPPGWRLLHATGVDDVSSTWVTRWTLLDLFVVLLIAIACAQLFGRGAGVLALAALVLSYTEPGALRWAWVVVLAGEALRRVLVVGRAARLVRALWQAALVALVLFAIPFAFALALLFWSVQHGLLGLPEMQVAGNGSAAYQLQWFQDRADAVLPRPWLLSVPLLAYRALMLAWALWLAISLTRWLRWGWAQFSESGIWRGRRVVPA